MTSDFFSIESISARLNGPALEYLTTAIPEHHRLGVFNFVVAQRQLFNQHAADLAAVLMAIEQAPSGLDLTSFEAAFIEWLRENGVSSSRITQLKGAIRIKCRALAEGSFYDARQREIIQALEVEKAYLFGRLTWEGQKQAFQLHASNGRITLQDLRLLLKSHRYDPTSQWSQGDHQSPSGKRASLSSSPSAPSLPSAPLSTKAYDLAVMLQGVVDELLDIQPQWEGDVRVVEVVDAQRLTDLATRFCAGRDTGWDF